MVPCRNDFGLDRRFSTKSIFNLKFETEKRSVLNLKNVSFRTLIQSWLKYRFFRRSRVDWSFFIKLVRYLVNRRNRYPSFFCYSPPFHCEVNRSEGRSWNIGGLPALLSLGSCSWRSECSAPSSSTKPISISFHFFLDAAQFVRERKNFFETLETEVVNEQKILESEFLKKLSIFLRTNSDLLWKTEIKGGVSLCSLYLKI